MSRHLAVTGVLESGAGLALIFIPQVVIDLLLNTTLDGLTSLTTARIAGAALTALAVACWLARNDHGSIAGRGLTFGMVLYNLCAVLVLGHAGLQSQLIGILLWPAIIIHAVMAVWCVLVLIRKA